VSFDAQLLAHLEHLARLRLSEPERRRLADELARIILFVESLDEIDPGETAPQTDRPPEEIRLRADLPVAGIDRSVALSVAPLVVEGEFAVPAALPVEGVGTDAEE